jgi:two-component system response regulator RegA
MVTYPIVVPVVLHMNTDNETEAVGAASQRQSILVVDDDEIFRTRLARAFSERGLDARTAAGFDEAVAAAHAAPPDLAVVDLRMPGLRTGLDLLQALLNIRPDTRAVMLTGYGSIATAIEAVRLGAVYYLPKPADADEVLAAFERNSSAAPANPTNETPSLARAEWEHIHRVLEDAEGNISEAARRLGIDRRSLQRKLQKYPPRR